MIKNKKILAVITARSGSKGIPHKNMQKLKGKSLIAWACETLIETSGIDHSIISTDSQDYANEAARCKVVAPFLRPTELSDDRASSADVLVHAINASEKHFNTRFDIAVLLEPTSPLRRPQDITQAIALLTETDADSVVSVSAVPSKNHPDKILKIEEDSKLSFYSPNGQSISSRQALSPLFTRNGIVYAVNRDRFLEKKSFITNYTVAMVINREVVNIDDLHELEWAEFLLQKQESKSK